jgi:hypothetical protein
MVLVTKTSSEWARILIKFSKVISFITAQTDRLRPLASVAEFLVNSRNEIDSTLSKHLVEIVVHNDANNITETTKL